MVTCEIETKRAYPLMAYSNRKFRPRSRRNRMLATFKLAEVPLCALTDPKADLLLAAHNWTCDVFGEDGPSK